MNKKEQVIEILRKHFVLDKTPANIIADQIDSIYNEPPVGESISNIRSATDLVTGVVRDNNEQNEFEFGELVESDAFFANNIKRKYLCFDGENHWCLDTENDYAAYKMKAVRKIKPTIEVQLSELIAEYKKVKNIEVDIKVI